MGNWGEFVHVRAVFFEAGEHPWTPEDWYANSKPWAEAAHITDRIVMPPMREGDEPRVAENDEWWADLGLWGKPPKLDADFKLLAPAVRLSICPLAVGASEKSEGHTSLINWEIDQIGYTEAFGHEHDELVALCQAHRTSPKIRSVALLTVWACSAGFSYIPGEPDEWESDYQLIGVVQPKYTGVQYEAV